MTLPGLRAVSALTQLQLARETVAGIKERQGVPHYARLVRDGQQDDDFEVLFALAGVIAGGASALSVLREMRAEIDAIQGFWTERLDTIAQSADALLTKDTPA